MSKEIENIVASLLVAIGENPTRDGLKDTPRRVAKFWAEFLDYAPGDITTTFDAVTTDQMIVISGMRVWSLCEHHLLPFWADISIGYIATERVLGLSKFARIAHQCAHKLQLQERLTREIADAVSDIAKTESVAVVASGEHLCMTMRGIKTSALMTSSVMRGAFRENHQARMEFLSFVKR